MHDVETLHPVTRHDIKPACPETGWFNVMPSHWVQRRMISVDNFIFEIIIFCFVVAI